MPEKSVTISVRLSSDDAAFLADYNSHGATTLSEKVRSIIAEAKQKGSIDQSYDESWNRAQSNLAPAMRQLREVEEAHNIHSELLSGLAHWLPDTTAHLNSSVPRSTDKDTVEKLQKLESITADKVFALVEQVLRLGVTGESPCYDPSVIVKRTSTVVRLCEIIKDTGNQK